MKASTLESFFLTVTLLSYLLILSTPFLLSRFIRSNNFFTLLLVSGVITFIFLTLSTYWSEDLSNKLMYKIYGFDDYGMSEEERFGNVSLENRQTIQKIYNDSFNVGWPLKLIMMYIILMMPYNIVCCGFIYLFKQKMQ